MVMGPTARMGAASAALGLLGLAAIAIGFSGAARRATLEQEYVVVSPGRSGGGVGGGMRQARLVALWGGAGKATTGTSVDGRKTVPGLHTDCIPGVLSSDCSPAQVRLTRHRSPSLTLATNHLLVVSRVALDPRCTCERSGRPEHSSELTLIEEQVPIGCGSVLSMEHAQVWFNCLVGIFLF